MTASAVQLAGSGDPAWVVPVSEAMLRLDSAVAEIAGTNIPVLLMGESGTGKEVLARRIHRLSNRSSQPFRKIACASMNAGTLSGEIARYAAPGVNQETRSGWGTVLFDELSDLDQACQRSLWCALPDGEPNSGPGMIQGRVMSTTTRDLFEEVRAGRLRSELYYRMNGVCFRLPPLREHKEDIPSLVEFFLTKHAMQLGRPRPVLRPDAEDALLNHPWPGNIRELENAVRKIVALGDETLAVAELRAVPSAPRKNETANGHGHSLKAAARSASREAERELILKALARTRWNRKRAAEELQISYKSLLYKLKQIGIVEQNQAD
jgi:two-component system, NtrC family, response regulator AtoC